MNLKILQTARALRFLILLALPAQWVATQSDSPRPPQVISFSQSLAVEGGTLQIDFAEGYLDLSRAELIQRIGSAAHAVAVYYGRFPVAKARVLVVPVAGAHGILQGTTWGNRSGFQAFLRLRIGQSTSRDELTSDWVITHELVHTALPSLADDQHWLEEGIASYVEPIARVQAGQLSATKIWTDMMSGMPNGEPGPRDRGLDITHTWGRTYWGGALFCLMADIEIRKQTGNRRGLQDALRAIVAAGGSIDKEWPMQRVLSIGDQATGTRVLEKMYAQWSVTPVFIDLPQLWTQLGVHTDPRGAVFDASAPLAEIRTSIANPSTPNDSKK